jgi:hypothetical protein
MKKHASTLQLLQKGSPRFRKEVIKLADKDLLYALCDCALNVLNGTIKLSETQKKTLKRHCKGLRCLIDKRTPLSKKKKVLQTGGFLPALLAPIAASILGPLLGGVAGGLASR